MVSEEKTDIYEAGFDVNQEVQALLLDKVAPVLDEGSSESEQMEESVKGVLDDMHEKIIELIEPEDKDRKKMVGLMDRIKDIELLAGDLDGSVEEFEQLLSKCREAFEMIIHGFNEYGVEQMWRVKTSFGFNGVFSRAETKQIEEKAKIARSPMNIEPVGYRVRDDVIYNPLLLLLACRLMQRGRKLLEQRPDFYLKSRVEEVEEMFLLLIKYWTNLKLYNHEEKSLPQLKNRPSKRRAYTLDLNIEKVLLELFHLYRVTVDSEELLKEIDYELKYRGQLGTVDASEAIDSFDKSVIELGNNGMYAEIMRKRLANPNADISAEAGQFIIDAQMKLASKIWFDEHGMPFSNDPSPQYPWADLNAYRALFNNESIPPETTMASNITKKFASDDRGANERYVKMREASAESQLRIMKRASVAEILRKLVNKDQQWGESRTLDDVKVGHLQKSIYESCELDPENILFGTHTPYVSAICRDLNRDYGSTAIPLEMLFEPLKEVLFREMEKFRVKLQRMYGGRFELSEPRTKVLESVLLKVLKEDKAVVGEVTDLIGFTVLTETEEETESVYYEIEEMMDPEYGIKPYNMWDKESSRGRRSMDITGVPKGSSVRIQVQVRPKKFEQLWRGRLVNHEAYKAITVGKLLSQINGDPDKYLDLLYSAIHNMRCSYEVCQRENLTEAKDIVEAYQKVDNPGFSIIRVGRLY